MRTSGYSPYERFCGQATRWILVAALALAANGCSSLSGSPNQVGMAEKAASLRFLLAGKAAQEKGDLAVAAADYAKAAAANPNSLETQLRLGAVSLAQKNEDNAYAAYQAAQRLAPKNPQAAFRLGEIDLMRGQADAASGQFAIALAIRKDDPRLYNAMGVALSLQGKFAKARQNFDKGLAIEPDYPALRNNYGLMQLASGDLKGALATFSTLVASSPDGQRYRFNRALVELAMGRIKAALADAPGVDENRLRQRLSAYRAAHESGIVAAAKRFGETLIAGGGKAAPEVHLDLGDAPQHAIVASDATAAVKEAPLPPRPAR